MDTQLPLTPDPNSPDQQLAAWVRKGEEDGHAARVDALLATPAPAELWEQARQALAHALVKRRLTVVWPVRVARELLEAHDLLAWEEEAAGWAGLAKQDVGDCHE